MNVLAIVFGVIVIVLVYVLYVYVFSGKTATLAKNVYLGKETAIVNQTDITKPGATNFNVSFWIYVNSWTSGSSDASQRASLIQMKSGADTYWKVSVDGKSPTLTFTSKTGTATTADIVITNNMPIQKWCYVVVNVNNSFIDSYLDGKMVMSQKTAGFSAPSESDAGLQVVIGDTKRDIYLSNVQRVVGSVSPKDVWTTYVSTANPTAVGPLPSYNVELSLLNNGAIQNTMRLY